MPMPNYKQLNNSTGLTLNISNMNIFWIKIITLIKAVPHLQH